MNTISRVGRDLSENSLSSAIVVYSRRFARKMHLTRLCDADHSILAVESQLIEMAFSSLMESMLINKAERSTVIAAIKFWISNWFYSSVDDDEIRQSLLKELSLISDSVILPDGH
jgi:hypothetical protein